MVSRFRFHLRRGFRPRPRRWVLRSAVMLWFCAYLGLGPACSQQDIFEGTVLDGPMGMVVAGPSRDHLFIANTGEDALQVLNMATGLSNIQFEAAPAKSFTLRIPTGPAPTDLAATTDGRFVLVLSTVREVIRLVDAQALALVRETVNGKQVPHELLIGGGLGSEPGGLTAAPGTCTATNCIGQFYVALQGSGAIATVQVIEATAGQPRLQLSGVAAVGGSPSHLAVHPDGDFIYFSDSSATELGRLHLASGSVQRLDIEAVGGALDVATDGTMLVVSRPSLLDVVVVEGIKASNTFALRDADAVWLPPPDCVPVCGEATASCTDGHVADSAFCTDATIPGVAQHQTGTPAAAVVYRGIYVGGVPSHLRALGQGAGQTGMAITCSSSQGTYNEYAVVALLGGSVRFVGLRDSDGNVAAELADFGGCAASAPSVGARDAEIYGALGKGLSDLLDPCPTSPVSRRAWACVEAGASAGESGVAIRRGQLTNHVWGVEWEGVLPGLNREAGGQITADGGFVDISQDLGSQSFRAQEPAGSEVDPATITYRGDILQITSTPVDIGGCAELQAAGTEGARPCVFERRIVDVGNDAGFTKLVLDSPLPTTCFFGGGVIAYRIRAGDQFLVRPPSGGVERVDGGTQFGPGTELAPRGYSLAKLKTVVSKSTAAACDRYDDTGLAVGPAEDPQDTLLSRDRELGFTVVDRFSPVRAGQGLNDRGQADGVAGRLPGGLAVGTGSEPIIFLSYAGSDTILGMIPYNTDLMFNSDRYRIIR